MPIHVDRPSNTMREGGEMCAKRAVQLSIPIPVVDGGGVRTWSVTGNDPVNIGTVGRSLDKTCY